MRCISGEEIDRVIEETHEGAGGNHSGGRALALRVRRQGHFWPTLLKDYKAYAARCEKCQRHAPMINLPTEALSMVTQPYPFLRWAMDIIGPLPPSKQKRFMIIMTDYFLKWVEAEAYANIKYSDVVRFVWKNIICRHEMPYEIVADNGSQFISTKFEGFCGKWKIRLNKSMVNRLFPPLLYYRISKAE